MINSLMKQWLAFQKMALDNAFLSMARMQDAVSEQVIACVEKNPLLPEEGRKAVLDWAAAYRRGRDEFRERVDASDRQAEAFFDGKVP
jgi:hypothetical protein